jgi:hypothetical protein
MMNIQLQVMLALLNAPGDYWHKLLDTAQPLIGQGTPGG